MIGPIIFGSILALVFCYALYVLRSVRRSVRLSAPLIAAAKPYEQRPTTAVMQILIAGDSTAVGVGTKPEDSIAGRIGKDVPAAAVTNIGVSGLRLAGLKDALASRGENIYDLVVLQIGANDITGRTPYTVIRKTLGDVLQIADGLGKRVVIVTAGNVGASPAFRWPLSVYMTARTRMVRNIFMTEIAKHQNAAYVDLFEERKDDTFSTDIPRYYAADFFHPSAEGYAFWYRKIRPALKL